MRKLLFILCLLITVSAHAQDKDTQPQIERRIENNVAETLKSHALDVYNQRVLIGTSAPSGTAPPKLYMRTSNGDVYSDNNGTWRLISASASAISGSGTSGQLAAFTGTTSIGGITLGGDCTFASPNITCTKTGGVSFSTLATTTPGTGVQTALGVNIGSAGAPVLFNGAGGTPSSLALANATGLPISTGVSGLGTGVATALAVNTGSAGAFVVNGGALGTPSSGTLTNATGLLATGGGTGQSNYTKGDVLASPGSNTLNKLGVGTDGQVLTADAASTNGVKWAAASATSKAVLGVSGGGTGIATASGTGFTSPFDPLLGAAGAVSDESAESFIVSYAGTLKNLFLRTTSTAATGGTTVTVTVRKNGVDTTLTATLSASASTSSSDTTHSVSVSQGDRISISLAPVGGVQSAGIASISIEYDSP